jgi:hypothetical protein
MVCIVMLNGSVLSPTHRRDRVHIEEENSGGWGCGVVVCFLGYVVILLCYDVCCSSGVFEYLDERV